MTLRLPRLAIEHKATGGLALALLLLLLIAFFSFRSTMELTEASVRTAHTQEVMTRVTAALSTLTDVESRARGYTVTGDEAFLEPYRQGLARTDEEFRALRSLSADNPLQQQRLKALEPIVAARLAHSKSVVELRRTQGFAVAQREIATGEGRRLHDAIRAVVAEMEKEETRLLRLRERRAESAARLTLAVSLGGSLLAFLLVGAAIFVTRRDLTARWEAEEALARASAWQKTILDSANLSIIATDPEGLIVTFNAAAERMLGYRAEEIVGKTTPALIHDPEEVQRAAADLNRELGRAIEPGFEVFVAKARSGQPAEREWTYVCKDGSRLPVWLSVTAMFDAARRITGFMGIATDLSERKREEERFRLVVEAAPNGIVTVDQSGVITMVNAQTERLFGYPREELVGQPVEVLVPERFRSSHPEHRRGFFADPKTRVMGAGRELFGLRKDGLEVPIEIGLNPFVTSEGTSVLALIIDITQRQQAEARLQRLQRHHERILDSVGEGLHGIDREGKIMFENPAAATMLGWDVRELIGRPAHPLMHHTRADGSPYPQSECHIYSTLGDGVTRRVEDEVFWRKDGSSFSVAYTSTPMRNDVGDIAFTIVAFRDMTERKRTEESLRRLNRELRIATERAQAADRIKSAFLATMSHELRTPLNSIIGFTGILLQRLAGPLNPEQSKQLEMVRGSSRHLLALINDVLDLSKIEAGELKVDCEPFDLLASITKVVGIVAPLAEKKGLALRTQLPPELGQVVGDARRVEQILLNLLNNAIKFTERGEVALTAELASDLEPPQSAIRLTVADTGSGIKPEDMATLFQPFRQIDSGLARNHEGTGLGLAICRRLADLLGGEIRAASVWGQGSRFSFTLPLQGPRRS